MPDIIIVMIHTALTVDRNNPVGFLLDGKHGAKILVTTDAIGIAVIGCVVVDRRIYQVVIPVVEIDIVDARHGIDYVQRTLQGVSVIFEHRTIKCTFHDHTKVITVLLDNGFHVLFIDGSEN